MEKLAVRKNDKKDIGLKRGETKVDPLNYGGGATLTKEDRQALSKIIKDLNNRFNLVHRKRNHGDQAARKENR